MILVKSTRVFVLLIDGWVFDVYFVFVLPIEVKV